MCDRLRASYRAVSGWWWPTMLATTLSLCVAMPMAEATQTLAPDPAFGSTVQSIAGRSSVSTQGVSARWSASQTLADGRVIVAGTACPTPTPCRIASRLAMARLTASGSLDGTFNPTGQRPGSVYFDLGGRFDLAGLAVDGLGRIIVAGNIVDSAETVVARFHPDGTLDTTFAASGAIPGIYRRNLGSSTTTQAVVVDASNRLVISGHVDAVPFVARLTSLGGTDFTFNAAGGSPGTLKLDASAVPGFLYGSATSVAIDGTDRIVIAGQQSNQNYFANTRVGRGNDYYGAPFVARVSSNGTLDPSFGASAWPGVAQFAGFNSVGNKNFSGRVGLAFDSLQRIVLGGIAQFTSYRGPLALRLDTSGIEDPTAYTYSSAWPTGGSPFAPVSSIAPLGSFNGVGAGSAGRIAVDTLGRVYIAGTYSTGVSPNQDLRAFVFRATSSLQPDSTFAPDVPGNPPARGIHAFDLTDGPYEWADTPSLASPDPPLFSADAAAGVAYLAGPWRNLPADGGVLRIVLDTGALDASYGNAGIALTGQVGVGTSLITSSSMAPTFDGKYVVVGRHSLAQNTAGGTTVSLLRFDRSGAVDATLEPAGLPPGLLLWAPSLDYTNLFRTPSDGPITAMTDADGKLVVAFVATVPSLATSNSAVVARFNADGTLDTTFNPAGTWPGVVVRHIGVSQANMTLSEIAQDRAGRYYLAGTTATAIPVNNTQIGFVARYTRAGLPDATFNDGINPFVTVRYGSGAGLASTADVIRVARDEKILVSGRLLSLPLQAVDGDTAVARYFPDGSQDTTFNPVGAFPGALVFPRISQKGEARRVDTMLELPDGRWLVGHEASNVGCSTCVTFPGPVVRRFTADGTLDTAYGGGTGYIRLASACYIRWAAARMHPDGVSYWLCAGYPPAAPSLTSYHTPPAVLRLDAAGNRDTAFGTGGEHLFPGSATNGFMVGHDLALDRSGVVIAAQLFPTATYTEATTLLARSMLQNVPGEPCAGFVDANSSDLLCANIEWLRNRRITLGCGGSNYCPQQPVSRDQMAAFLNRLGTALTPVVSWKEQATGNVTLGNGTVVCETPDFNVADFPRTANLDAIFMATAPTDTPYGADLVASYDAGATWTNLAAVGGRGTVPAGQWSNARVRAVRDLAVGQTVRFGLRVTRGDLSGTAALVGSQCQLRSLVVSRDGTQAPY